MLLTHNLGYRFPGRRERPPVLQGINLQLLPGEVVCLLGSNGCGKSTLARLLNGLLLPSEGRVVVEGLDTLMPEHRWTISCLVGMVGPDPDSQLVATLVEEEIAFGPSNLGLSLIEVRERVRKALALMKIEDLAGRPVQFLSVGQKLKVLLAAVLAMEPRFLILDEAASMLEPGARRDLGELCRKLAKSLGIGILIITHSGEEFLFADRVLVMREGLIVAEFATREIMLFRDLLQNLGWPPEGEMVARLIQAGYDLPPVLLTPEEAGEILCSSN